MTTRILSHAERIHASLLDGLRTGAFDNDHRFVDTEVAAEYGSSRMPAREALLRLTAEGYLMGTTRGFVIPTLSPDEIADLSEVRRQLEPRAAASAAGNMSEPVRAALADAIAGVRAALAAQDLPGLMRANVAFRDAWLGAVTNRRLAAIIARFMDQLMPLRRDTFEHPLHRLTYVGGMEALYTALVRGDALQAGDAMTKFMFDAEVAFLEVHAAQISQHATTPSEAMRRRRAGETRRHTA